MNLKDILIHVDNRPTCASRMKTAIALAKRQEARVTGLYVIPHPYYASHHRNPLDKAEEARQSFIAAVEAAGADGVVFERIVFCDPWGADLHNINSRIKKENPFPMLALTREYNIVATGQIKTRVQAF